MRDNKLIVALDVDTVARARDLFASLRDLAGMFKIGMQLFTAAGPSIVREIIQGGGRVFLDLKYHDIPNTVAGAAVEATRLGVSIFNVHAAGGSEMMRRTAAAVAEISAKEELLSPRVIAVTLLTSADTNVLKEIGITNSTETQVVKMAQLALESGLDGVVASPLEVTAIRRATNNRECLIVTPGVRPHQADHNDQRRITTAREALVSGSDYIVVGRPIIEERDPVEATRRLLEEIEEIAVVSAGRPAGNRNS